MSNLTSKITDPHLSVEEPLTFRRCLRLILQALAAGLRLRSHHQNYRNFISFLLANPPAASAPSSTLTPLDRQSSASYTKSKHFPPLKER